MSGSTSESSTLTACRPRVASASRPMVAPRCAAPFEVRFVSELLSASAARLQLIEEVRRQPGADERVGVLAGRGLHRRRPRDERARRRVLGRHLERREVGHLAELRAGDRGDRAACGSA